eukprot:5812236-Amphidinium_carterae.1
MTPSSANQSLKKQQTVIKAISEGSLKNAWKCRNPSNFHFGGAEVLKSKHLERCMTTSTLLKLSCKPSTTTGQEKLGACVNVSGHMPMISSFSKSKVAAQDA